MADTRFIYRIRNGKDNLEGTPDTFPRTALKGKWTNRVYESLVRIRILPIAPE
jgi:hypothetical protein